MNKRKTKKEIKFNKISTIKTLTLELAKWTKIRLKSIMKTEKTNYNNNYLMNKKTFKNYLKVNLLSLIISFLMTLIKFIKSLLFIIMTKN